MRGEKDKEIGRERERERGRSANKITLHAGVMPSSALLSFHKNTNFYVFKAAAAVALLLVVRHAIVANASVPRHLPEQPLPERLSYRSA